ENTLDKGSSLSYIKRLCVDHLFTYEGYLKAVKKKFDMSYKIPLYISDTIQLIPTKRTRDYENIWINYASIFRIEVDQQIQKITFYSGNTIHINSSNKTLKQQIKYLEQIRNTKVKHFHTY
ncbi:MAG: competence protein ComK, partial [Acholeplasmataceae bacterium]|nr:competence protein ComK [Acholeplasmataceae bacterium]